MASEVRITPFAASSNTPIYVHEAVIEDLTAGAEYLYDVAPKAARADGRFRLRTPASGPVKFVIFGDSGTGAAEQLQLVPWMLWEKPDFVLHTGDLAYPSGTWAGYRDFYFAPYRDLMTSTPFYPCPGNHDYVNDAPEAYRALMRVPTETVPSEGRGLFYSFDWGDVHFASLDTNLPLEQAAGGNGSMLNWLASDLRRSVSPWKIVFFHHTPYATGRYEGTAQVELVRREVVPILEQYGVQVVFAGHEHNYQRSHPIRKGVIDTAGGIVYITTGGGGGGLYAAPPGPLQAAGLSMHHFVVAEIDGSGLHLRAIGPDGGQIDAASLVLR